jgi:hypothetical protein
MLGVELICTDEACAEVKEVNVFSLEELTLLTCDGCGCTLQSLNIWEVVEMRVSRPATEQLRRAA